MKFVKNIVFCSLFLAFSLILEAQLTVPKLVVCITVDQLRSDYLQYFSSTFGEKGFKRLMNEGLYYRSVDFGFSNLSESSSIASIYTGTYPYYNGISGDMRFDWTQEKAVSIVHDINFMGNYTTDRVSPLALQTTTIGDILKKASNGSSKVYSVAPNAGTALLSAGRWANAAFWLDDVNGKWATSTYYKDVPNYVERFNTSEAIGNYPERTWEQSYSYYNEFPYSQRTTPFSYRFSQKEKDAYTRIKKTPLINSEITNLANRFFENARFTRNTTPDFLALTYYAGNYPYATDSTEYNYEIQDIYYRLDKEMEKLIDLIDRKIGLKHVLIVLSSTGYYDELPNWSSDYKPFGTFYPDRCTSLLNMYLMAIYGEGNWVKTYFDRYIFLNKKLAEEKKVNWKDLLLNAADFVSQFSGIQSISIPELSHEIHPGIYRKNAGDLFIEIQSSWAFDGMQTQRKKNVLSPLFFFGEQIHKEQVTRKVKATEIAPSIAYLLRIAPPDNCIDLPLAEIFKSH